MTRIIERRYLLDDGEKERFLKVMRLMEAFTGVGVITFCVLDTHLHLLLEVCSGDRVPEPVVLARVSGLYGKRFGDAFASQVRLLRQQGDDAGAECLLDQYRWRMNDLSVFMKELLQRFTQSYNGRHKRRGTLWEDRFKSVLVEGSGNALAMMAAYIDLNPVRAGIVEDPKDYRYCGYGQAVAGGRLAQAGLSTVMESLGQLDEAGWGAEAYRRFVFMQGATHAKGGTSTENFRQQAEEVLAQGGTLSAVQLLHCRVRYFSDGVVFGGKTFVEDVFQRNREQFGLKRKSGARPLRRTEAGGLCTMRDLRLEVISRPKAA
jgi:REP element-mobilizing transposase RayT